MFTTRLSSAYLDVLLHPPTPEGLSSVRCHVQQHGRSIASVHRLTAVNRVSGWRDPQGGVGDPQGGGCAAYERFVLLSL